MSNQNQLFRRTTAILLASCLLVGLLPGFAAARDYTEARAASIINYNWGTNFVTGKEGWGRLLARLELEPDNPQFLDNIAYYWGTAGDPMPTGDNKTFSSHGVGWLFNKHGDKLTQPQRDNLLFQAKRYNFPANPDGSAGGSENHRLMQDVGAILLTQYFPNETGWSSLTGRGSNRTTTLITSEELFAICKNRLLTRLSRIYDRGSGKRLSVTYLGAHTQALLALYTFVNDPELKAAANAALVYYHSELSMASLEGVVAHPSKRSPWQMNTEIRPSATLINWFYWGELMNIPEIDSYPSYRGTGRAGVPQALSSWRPPTALRSLFAGDDVVPFTCTSSSNSRPEAWAPADMVTYFYRTSQYAMGSAYLNMRAGSPYSQDKGFLIAYKSSKKFNIIECGHNYWSGNENTWPSPYMPTVSPFTQRAQHESTAILLFDVPASDPWAGYGLSHVAARRDQRHDNLWQEAWLVYPQSADEIVEDSGWIFLREGTGYVAIRTANSYTSSTTDYAEHVMARSTNDNGNNAAIFDIATSNDFATFASFRAAVLAAPLIIDLAGPSVTYTNVKGDTISSSWTPTDYNVSSGTPVLIRPTYSVNGVTVSIDTDFENELAVIKSPPLRLKGRVLTVDTPSGGCVVDWRGDVPKFSDRTD